MKNSPLDGNVTFLDILLIIKQRVKLVLGIPIIVCLVVIIYVQFFAETVYTSEAKIISSSSSNSHNSQAVNIASQFGFNLRSQSSDPVWVYPEIIKSRTLVKKVLKREFSEESQRSKPLYQIIGSQMGLIGDYGVKERTLIVNRLITMLEVTENLKTGVYTFRVSAFEPKLSAEIARAFITELDMHQRNYNKEQVLQTRKFIELRINETQKDLTNAEDALKVFRTRNRGIQNSPFLQLQEERYSREVNVQTQVFINLKQQLENAKIDEVKKNDYVIVIDEPEVPIQRSKPKKRQMVIMSFIASMLLGTSIALILEYVQVTMGDDERKKFKKLLSL